MACLLSWSYQYMPLREEICPDPTLPSVPLHPLDITGSLLGNRVAPCAGMREQQTDGWPEGRITRKGRPPVITGKWCGLALLSSPLGAGSGSLSCQHPELPCASGILSLHFTSFTKSFLSVQVVSSLCTDMRLQLLHATLLVQGCVCTRICVQDVVIGLVRAGT